jgi:Fic family protein
MINEIGESVGVLFDTTSAYLTPSAMQEVVEWTGHTLSKASHHPLLVIGSFIVEFLKIHPFEDGNGRLSRILTNMLLLQSGYAYTPYISHEKLIEDNKPDYYLALRKTQNTFGTDSENLDPWMTFFLDIVLEQSKRAVSLITEERFETILSKNQRVIWQYIQGMEEVAVGDIVKGTEISRATVKQAVVKLQELGKIEMLGSGRGSRYRKKV